MACITDLIGIIYRTTVMATTELLTTEDQIRSELLQIERAINDNTYKPGRWQRLLNSLYVLDRTLLRNLKPNISHVSNRLHSRNNFLTFSFLPIYLGELVLCGLAVNLSQSTNLIERIIATALFALTLQPLLKITTGIAIGVRYSYAYLWYVEPRFKMQYGDYVSRQPWQRMLLHLMGSLGTPIAMYIGINLLSDNDILSFLCVVGFVAVTLMQIGALVAALLGVRKVGGFVLHQLTTPAMLGVEIKTSLANRK